MNKKLTWVSGRANERVADSRADIANMVIGMAGDISARFPTVVARTWRYKFNLIMLLDIQEGKIRLFIEV